MAILFVCVRVCQRLALVADADTAPGVGPDRLPVGPGPGLEAVREELAKRALDDLVADAESATPGKASGRRSEPDAPVELPGLSQHIVPPALRELFTLAIVGGVDVEGSTDSFDEHGILLCSRGLGGEANKKE